MTGAAMPLDEMLEADLLVIGGGMAGMTAAASAARHGARVIVAEKGPDVGGSAVLSAGGLLCPRSAGDLAEVNPTGDRHLAELLVDWYDDAVAWVASLGVAVTEPNDTIAEVVGYPAAVRGHDVIAYIERCKTVVHQGGGWIVTNCEVLDLRAIDGAVRGAVVRDGGGDVEVDSRWTLIATGGFQNDAVLRETYLGDRAQQMLVRSNPHSAGDGLRLAAAVGASLTEHMDRFYGHTVPWPLTGGFLPRDYRRLAQPFLATRCLLLDENGQRFGDESLGYYGNAHALLRRPRGRALLVGDQRIREADIDGGAQSRTLGQEHLDRPAEARRAGGHVAEVDSLMELDDAVADWGYRGVAAAVSCFNAAVGEPGVTMTPTRRRNREPISSPPFFAMEVQPAITNTWGGLRVDSDARVLDGVGSAIPGLLAAGADVGGAYHEAYGGGLALACVLGLRAAMLVIDAVAEAT